jgi:CubicO group peptidase (beta-lactamase class C family)
MFPRFAFTFLLAGACLAQNIDSRMDQVVQSFVANKQFMGSVLVARGDQVLFSKGYGSANLEWGIPDTATWDKMTIFHVLTHTAGIPNFTGFPDYAPLEPFATTPEKLVARFRDKPLEFEPGEKWNYSNSGYALLGYLIEKISGESYESFVQKNIFTALGMKDSGYDSNSAVIARHASGYSPSPNGLVNAGFVHMSVPYAAGALLFHHGRSVEVGAGSLWREITLAGLSPEDDHAIQE